ncbi:Ig-like domain repeat protein [Nocardioides sp. URHA0020]|uniref:Ig-like domain repeat protein n=1 Tax=Nocardioides sp. URHA0020 TaxID=1380392 RepID=UPI00048DFF7C|nr:Ig-like domain repeat protein [Nocardioides sp. URHA0020]
MRLSAALAALVAAVAVVVTGPGPAHAADPAGPFSPNAASQVDPHCSGSAFRTTPQDPQLAADLMAGRLKLPTFATWRLPVDPTWAENPFSNVNWDANYQMLRWVDPLRRVGLATRNQAMLERYAALFQDWLADNPPNASPSHYAWADMVDGVRAIGLVCLGSLYDVPPPWLVDAEAAHAAVLMDPRHYRTVGNHGLWQNTGLLALGCSSNVPAWRDLAVKRAMTMLGNAVDKQGVIDEGSLQYQVLNYMWYQEFATRMEACGLTPGALFKRLERMPDFIAQATQPDGNLVAFGDTSAIRPAPSFRGTTTEYAATRGESGPHPGRTFSLYGRGYAFSRSGWFDTQRADQQSLVSVRFAQSMKDAVHGQEDAGNVGYFAHGRQILWQPGVYGGGGGAPRRYVVSNEAHNVLDIPGRPYDRTARTPLLASRSTRQLDLVSVRTHAITGATWQRTVIHLKAPELLLVDDQVRQPTSRPIVQRWQLAADRSVTSKGCGRAETAGPGTDATLVWAGSCPQISVVKGRKTPTLLGWRSEDVNKFVPTPTLQATTSGRSARLTALVVPRATGHGPSTVRVLRTSTTGQHRVVDVLIDRAGYRITFNAARATVRPLRSSARVRVSAPGRISATTRATVRTGVHGDWAKATGRVTVQVDGRSLATGTLRQGGAAIRLPRLGPGTHHLRVVYRGSSAVRPATSTTRTVVVRRR